MHMNTYLDIYIWRSRTNHTAHPQGLQELREDIWPTPGLPQYKKSCTVDALQKTTDFFSRAAALQVSCWRAKRRRRCIAYVLL